MGKSEIHFDRCSRLQRVICPEQNPVATNVNCCAIPTSNEMAASQNHVFDFQADGISIPASSVMCFDLIKLIRRQHRLPVPNRCRSSCVLLRKVFFSHEKPLLAYVRPTGSLSWRLTQFGFDNQVLGPLSPDSVSPTVGANGLRRSWSTCSKDSETFVRPIESDHFGGANRQH